MSLLSVFDHCESCHRSFGALYWCPRAAKLKKSRRGAKFRLAAGTTTLQPATVGLQGGNSTPADPVVMVLRLGDTTGCCPLQNKHGNYEIMRFSRNFPKSGKPTSTESPGTGVFEFSGAIWTPLDTLESELRVKTDAFGILSGCQI